MSVDYIQTFLRYLFCGLIAFFLQHAVMGIYYRIKTKNRVSIYQTLMCLGCIIYISCLLCLTFEGIAQSYAEPILKLAWFGGILGFSCYMGIVKDVLGLGRWVYTVKDCHLILGFIFLIDIFGDSYTYLQNPNTGESWIGLLFNNGYLLTNFGVILSFVIMLVVISVNLFLLYFMIVNKKKEHFLFIGIIISLLSTINDILIGIDPNTKTIPLYYLAGIFEAIRFNIHLKNKHFEKIQELRIQNLLKTKKIEEGLFSKKLLHILSHDINNGLLATKIALNGVENSSEKETLDSVKQAKKGLQKISQMSRSVLALEKLRTDFSKIELSSVNLLESLKECIVDFQYAAIQKSITFVVDCDESLSVLSNKQALESHVLSNLISNAIKFSPVNSAVSICARMESNCISLTISDLGEGVACGDVEKLFSDCGLPSKPGTNSEIGSGVGLSMVKLFMDSFNGHVEYVEQEIGASFKLTFKVS